MYLTLPDGFNYVPHFSVSLLFIAHFGALSHNHKTTHLKPIKCHHSYRLTPAIQKHCLFLNEKSTCFEKQSNSVLQKDCDPQSHLHTSDSSASHQRFFKLMYFSLIPFCSFISIHLKNLALSVMNIIKNWQNAQYLNDHLSANQTVCFSWCLTLNAVNSHLLFRLLLSYWCFRGPPAIWLPQHRHGPPAEGGGAHPDGDDAVRRQWYSRPGDLLVQGLPARGAQQQPGSHQAAPIRWDQMAFCLFVCLFCFFVGWFLIWAKLNKDTVHSEA